MARQGFKPGHPGGPGRPKGSPNKLTKTVKQAFEEAFNALQADPGKPYALAEWGKKQPDKFYLIASKLIPTKVEAEVDDVTNLTDTQRAARLAALTNALVARATQHAEGEADGSDLV